jgi:hypothetical protein
MMEMRIVAALLLIGICFPFSAVRGAEAASEIPSLDAIRVALRADNARRPPAKNVKRGDRDEYDDETALTYLDDAEGEGISQVVRTVRNLRTATSSEKIRQQCDAFLLEVRRRESEAEKKFEAEGEAAIQRATAATAKASSAPDLDPSISELRSISEHAPHRTSREEEWPMVRRLTVAREEVERWQTFLSQREAGNSLAAATTLQRISDQDQQGLDLPRSAIETRIRELEAEGQKTLDEKGRVLLQKIHGLEDVRPVLDEMRALPSAQSNYLHSMVNNLETIARTYAGLKQDVATTLNFTYTRPGDSDPLIVHLHSDLLLLALPRFLQVPDSDKPTPGETVETYIRRMTDLARTKSDWDLLGRVLEARKQITLHVAGTWSSDALERYASFNNFQRARVLERAGQYTAAVALYQSALRQGGDFIPPEVIGEKLETIKKEHPAEFAEGTKPKRPPADRDSSDHHSETQMPGDLHIPAATAAVTPEAKKAPSSP